MAPRSENEENLANALQRALQLIEKYEEREVRHNEALAAQKAQLDS